MPTIVKAFKSRVVDISMGLNHTAVLVEPGQVCTFGQNTHAQLGHGNAKIHNFPMLVRSIAQETVTASISCLLPSTLFTNTIKSKDRSHELHVCIVEIV